MDQDSGHIPNWGDADDSDQIGIKVNGTIAHGREESRRVFLSYNQPGNTNTVIETIIRTIVDLYGGELKKVPPILFLQLDNTSSTNKNNIQMVANAALVELGIFREVWISFLMVGHTHEDIDQMFSCLAHAFDARPPRSLREMCAIIRSIKPGGFCGSRETVHGVCKETLGGIKPIILDKVVDYKVSDACEVVLSST